MKTLVTVCLLSVMCLGCERGRFDVSNPDVTEFVKQLKNGTYDQYEWTEDGDRPESCTLSGEAINILDR